MYKKVNTELNFVEREKATEKFWRDNDIFKKSPWRIEKRERLTPFMMDRQQPTASRISVMY